jgi:hypothetical protein
MLSWRPWRFSLRALLAVTLVASAGLWWWFRPISVEKPWAYGLTIHYQIRRSWNGDRYYVGPATLRYQNENISAISNVNGLKWNSVDPFGDVEQAKYWHEDGRKLSSSEWFLYLSTEYIPRNMNGEPINTEEEWRRMNAELAKKHPETQKKSTP